METLFRRHDVYLANTPMSIVREAEKDIHWQSRLIAIVGARGVGKSTLIKQHIKLNFNVYDRTVLYCSLDSLYFSAHSLLELAETFVNGGGKSLYLDEIHKYASWSREIKEIYDLYPELQLVISGSSLLQILNADADLSRRCVRFALDGLSFREFLSFYKGISIQKIFLDDVLQDSRQLCAEVNSLCNPLKYFKEYMAFGYYPFYLESVEDYYTKIEQVVNFVIEVELPLLRKVEVGNVRKLKALVELIAREIPYEVDASKLARAVGIGRDTVIEYLGHLADAKIFNLLYSDIRSIGRLSKPDKIYLENPNLLYALSSSSVNIGTARETFVVSQLKGRHTVEYAKSRGDFKVDRKYTFEVGGKDKSFSQVAGVENSYVLADDIEAPYGRKLPLWVVGFLY